MEWGEPLGAVSEKTKTKTSLLTTVRVGAHGREVTTEANLNPFHGMPSRSLDSSCGHFPLRECIVEQTLWLEKLSNFKIFLFMGMDIWPNCVSVCCVHAWCLRKPEECTGSDGCDLPCGF